MKRFNVTGVCIPGKHYMADISQKVAQILWLSMERKNISLNENMTWGKVQGGGNPPAGKLSGQQECRQRLSDKFFVFKGKKRCLRVDSGRGEQEENI